MGGSVERGESGHSGREGDRSERVRGMIRVVGSAYPHR